MQRRWDSTVRAAQTPWLPTHPAPQEAVSRTPSGNTPIQQPTLSLESKAQPKPQHRLTEWGGAARNVPPPCVPPQQNVSIAEEAPNLRPPRALKLPQPGTVPTIGAERSTSCLFARHGLRPSLHTCSHPCQYFASLNPSLSFSLALHHNHLSCELPLMPLPLPSVALPQPFSLCACMLPAPSTALHCPRHSPLKPPLGPYPSLTQRHRPAPQRHQHKTCRGLRTLNPWVALHGPLHHLSLSSLLRRPFLCPILLPSKRPPTTRC